MIEMHCIQWIVLPFNNNRIVQLMIVRLSIDKNSTKVLSCENYMI